MMPPKPPRKSLMRPITITSSCDVVQPTYEDPDALVPSVADGSQPEVIVKPVPRPRTKTQPNAECNNNTVDSVDKNGTTTSAAGSKLNGFPADCKRPRPVRPPPRPPVNKPVTSSKPTAAAEGANRYLNLNVETTAKRPADNTERLQTLPPPRPPPPSNYYDRQPCVRNRESEIYTDESQQSRQSPVSPDLSEEVVGLCGTYGYTVFSATDSTDRPAVPPRPGQSSLPRSASECETSPTQTKPPLPPFKPPPPPSTETPPESVYSEIEYRPYLDVLPEDDDDMMSQASTLPFGQRYRSDCSSSHRQTTSDTEDINGMLRWLKRVSKSDFMGPSLYGLSIQEEISSFNQRAMNVKKALRLYNLLMMKRSEDLRNLITEFSSISNSLDKMQKKSKTIGIAGGTTGAVGGMTAVLGIALAPVTMGTSLIATAVGAGIVATAGGVGAQAAKANKKVVNRMSVDKLVYEYKKNVVDLENCLDFILCEMNELRRHDIPRLQRAGTQTDSLKMAHLAQFVIRNNMNNDRKTSAHSGMSSERLLKAFDKEMDQYFTEKEGQKLKKSNKSKFSGRVRLLAKNLQDELDHLNRMWEMFS